MLEQPPRVPVVCQDTGRTGLAGESVLEDVQMSDVAVWFVRIDL